MDMNAYLLLANGTVFAGKSLGCPGVTVGEVVFATGMVGFEETLTDPSYYGQIITQTYPLIGNYGMNGDDMESEKVWARGYIVREACTAPSNWRSETTLDAFLKAQGVSILLSEQNPSFAGKVADRVYELEKGQIHFTPCSPPNSD